jgi:uncharacterized membrane protein YsdA (DUF1294 family)
MKTFAFSFAALFLAAIAAFVRWAELPTFVFWTYLVASVAAFVVYAVDKSAAGGGRRRVPESTLHLLAWLGGWPGALVAQHALAHKTRKAAFQIVFWLTVAAHCGAVGWWASTHR